MCNYEKKKLLLKGGNVSLFDVGTSIQKKVIKKDIKRNEWRRNLSIGTVWDIKTKGILFSLYIKNVRTKFFDKHPLSIIIILKI